MTASYSLIKTISISPKNPESFDFGWVDYISQRYYLTDRTNSCIDVVDASNHSFVGSIGGFTGQGQNFGGGPNGLFVSPELNQLWAGDGDSSLKVVDLRTNTIIKSISTGGSKRIDLIGYDQKHQIVVGANDRDTPPYVSFVSAKDYSLLGKIMYPHARAIEEPAWNPYDGKFYLALPSTTTNPGGEIDVIDPLTMQVVDVYRAADCRPNGIAFGSNHVMVVPGGGGIVSEGGRAKTCMVDTRNGDVVKTIYDVGGSDQVWFNPGDDRFYIAASGMTSDGMKSGAPTPVLGVIDAKNNEWLVNVPTGSRAHSVAANRKDNHVFVPIPGSGVAVYAETSV